MVRIISWSILCVFLATWGSAKAQERTPEPFVHREIPGPKRVLDERSIFAHVHQVAFTRDGATMAAGAGANIFVWNVADGKELVRMQLPDEQIYHRLAFADDGKTLVWCGREDPMIRIWDVATGRQLREFPQPNSQQRERFSSRFLAFSTDAKRIAFYGPSFFEGIDILDVATGKIAVSIKDQKDCRGCTFSANGKLLAAHSGNGGLRLWDTSTGKLIRELRADSRSGAGAYKFIVFSPDAAFLAAGGHTQNSLDVWSVAAAKLVCSIPTKSYFYSAAFAPDNQSVVCVEADGRPYLYHLVAEKAIHRFNPPERLCHFVAFAPDSKRVALIAEPAERDANFRQESIYLYEIPASALNPPAAQVDDAALEKLWAELATDNDLRLQRILTAFRSAPQPTVALLQKKAPPVTKERQAKMEQWIAELNAADFTQRDQAMQELRGAAHQFAPLLKSRQERAAPGEIRNRLTFILNQTKGEAPPASLIQELRAISLLEQIATPEAQKVLKEIAAGATQARITVEAQAALGRIGKAQDK
jgi:hypothetical protein